MTIDILEYELKYKNNRHVLDLLEAFKLSEEQLKADENITYDQSEEIDDLNVRVASLDGEIERRNRETVKLIRRLEESRSLKKADMVEAVNDVISELEGMQDD